MDEWLYELDSSIRAVHSGPGPLRLRDIDYDWITQNTGESVESIKDKTLLAWIDSTDYRQRAQAALEGGTREWGRLLHDDSYLVRGSVAMAASTEYQLQLVHDPEPIVREQCAIFGSGKVRMALIAAHEPDLSVISTIAQHGNVQIRKQLVETYWQNPEALCKIMPQVVQSDLYRLMDHPDKAVRMETAQHGNRDIVKYVMCQDDISAWDKAMLQLRLDELQEISEALSIPFEIEAEHTPITADQAKEMIEQTVDDALSL